MPKMIKIKATHLTNIALDYLVAQIEGESVRFDGEFIRYAPSQFSDEGVYSPSTDPAIGYLIIEREKIQLRFIDSPGHKLHGLCLAQGCLFRPTDTSVQWKPFGTFSVAALDKGYLSGPTGLVAAMRYFVCMRLGDVVEIPANLKGL